MAEIIPGNDVVTTLAVAINNSTTSVQVINAAYLPQTGDYRIRCDNEIMKVTSVSGNTLTVERAAETVNGTASAASHDAGATVVAVVTNDQFAAISVASSDIELLDEQTASASASLDFTSLITSDYDNYLLLFDGVSPATDAANLQIKISSDNGSSWIAGTSYNASYVFSGPSTGHVAATGTSAFVVAQANENSAGGVSGRVEILGPLLAQYTQILIGLAQINSGDGLPYTYTGGGAYTATTAINAIQVYFSSGNIASGKVSLYGYKNITGGGGGGNATSIRSVIVDDTAPTDGQVLQYDSGADQWVPSQAVPFKQTILVGNGNKTTNSTSLVVIDSTNLPYLTLDCDVNDVIKIEFTGQIYVGTAEYAAFDVEVDRPTSGDTRVYASTDTGIGFTAGHNLREIVGWTASYVIGEAGVHGFRPMWKVNAGTATLCNATSGADDSAIVFSIYNLGPVTA